MWTAPGLLIASVAIANRLPLYTNPDDFAGDLVGAGER